MKISRRSIYSILWLWLGIVAILKADTMLLQVSAIAAMGLLIYMEWFQKGHRK